MSAPIWLTPARYQSGETDIPGRIRRCGDELARTALYEAAQRCSCGAGNGRAARLGNERRKTPRHGPRPVAVARKLAVIFHRMWRDAADFRFGDKPARGKAAA